MRTHWNLVYNDDTWVNTGYTTSIIWKDSTIKTTKDALFVSSAFDKHLYYPQALPKRKKTIRNQEILPKAISGVKWRQYLKDRETKKIEEENAKKERLELREKKRMEKKQQKKTTTKNGRKN